MFFDFIVPISFKTHHCIGPEPIMQQMKQFDLDVATLNSVTMRIESFPLALPFLKNDGLVEHVGSRSHSVSSRPNSSTNISDEINAAVALRTGSATSSSGNIVAVPVTTFQFSGQSAATEIKPPTSSRRSTFKTTLSAPTPKAAGVFHGSPVKGSGNTGNMGSSGKVISASASWLNNTSKDEEREETEYKKVQPSNVNQLYLIPT